MPFDWRAFLTRWSKELLDDPEIVRELPAGVVASGWLGYRGATAEQLADLETRLGATLPPSYRAFLSVSNGWRNTSPFIDRVLPTEEVDWFATRHQQWIDAYVAPAAGLPRLTDAEYLVYGQEQSTVHFRTEYLQTALQISDVGDAAIYLLNPQVVTPEGEWEARFFANWHPGAVRHRSFQEMMQAEDQTFLDLR